MPGDTSTKPIKWTKLSAAVRASLSLLAAGSMAAPPAAIAQQPTAGATAGATANAAGTDVATQELEEVVVRGMRLSLENAQERKRRSTEIVDSVTAEDIMALPDRSVTETLQRIPGVAINRFAAGRDPDHFSVEGSGVVVRGLTYVRSEINGRDSFTANNGRGLSFADVPPELLSGVDVFKSPSASHIEGGIAGTVNLRTRKPFDSSEPVLAFSAEANYGDFIDEVSPTVSALGSYRWDTGIGEFGVLGSYVYSQVQSRADRFQVSNFSERTLYSTGDVVPSEGATETGKVIFPRGAVVGTQEFDREREGISAALQWRSPDEGMEATFQFLRSDSKEAWTEHVVEIATDNVANNGDSRAVPGTTLGFGSNGVFDNGFITGPTGWRDDQWSGDPRTPISGLQSNNIRRDVKQQYVTDDYSLNFRWEVNDDWALLFDYQHVDSEVDNLDAGLWASSFQNMGIDMRGSRVPKVVFTPPILCDGAPSNNCPQYFRPGNDTFADPYNSFYRAAMDHLEKSEGTSDAFRIDAERQTPESDWLRSVRFGVRHAERDQTARFSTYNWGSLSEIWGAGGPVWLDDPVSSNGEQPLGGFEEFKFKNFFNGDAKNPLAGQGRLYYDRNIVNNYADYAAYAKAIAAEWGPSASWRPLAERADAIDGSWFLPGEVNPVVEKNDAAYVEINFDTPLDNGWGFSGNVGVRYTDTGRSASGFQSFNSATYTAEEDCLAPPEAGQELSAFCALPASVRAETRAFSDGTSTPFNTQLDYDYWLPSLNLKLKVAEGLQFRAAYFKGVAAPDFGLTRAYYNVPKLSIEEEDIEAGNGRPIARFSAGNPYLKPVTADNYDLTAEWYFSAVGQLTFALFYKELHDIRTNDIQRVSLTNNGATFDAIVTTAVNSKKSGTIEGFEVAYQQTYDQLPGIFSGLGLAANYTFVDSSNVPQSTLSETDPDVAAGNQSTVDVGKLPLEGLSEHTFNIMPFYERGPLSVRLAYSWRDEFLLTIRDVIVPFQPIINEASGQLDGSIFYNISKNWTVGLQGVNLLNETIRTSAVVNDDLQQVQRSWFVNDARYSFIVRGKF